MVELLCGKGLTMHAEVDHSLGSMLATMADGFVIVDSDLHCRFVNEVTARLSGHPWRDMIGQAFCEVASDVIGNNGKFFLQQALEQHTPVRFEHLLATTNRWLEHRAYPAEDGLVLFSVDITAKKEEELRFLEMRERLFATWDYAPVGISETAPDGQYLKANRKWCEITGYQHEELLKKTFLQITLPEDVDEDAQRYRALLREEINGYNLEKRYVRKDGSILWVQVHRTLVHRPDGSTFAIGVAEDISARREAEQALRQAEQQLRQHAGELEGRVAERTIELEKSNKAMESFCYTIAHDLRAPVRAMQGLTQVLVEDYGVQLDLTGRDYTDRINRACNRLDSLIKDLLVFGQLTHIKLPAETINLGDVLARVLARFTGQIETSGASVEVVEPLAPVSGNVIVLKQILSNLISNALTFVAAGKKPCVKIWTETSGSTVTISVQDNGVGIAPQYHDRIFRLFETLHPIGTLPGTGIGLALVRQGVERLGGRVGVESSEGKGSRFWVQLPAAQSA